MTEIEGGGPDPFGQVGRDSRDSRDGRLYAYRVRGRERGAVVLWVGGRGGPVVVNLLAHPRTRAVVRGAAATPGAG
ncbi:hypothetical protein ACFWBH_21660 [Streptomyces sp. NPDC059999]|uniref:hypothetical protein n=1 Tax=Streptomyces sp. NPDC059999 TaxID=3347030 RepID=UPI0036973A9A